MLIDGIKLAEGSTISNVAIATGANFPSAPDAGELFFKTSTQLLYCYNGSAWKQAGGSTTLGSTQTELGGTYLTLAGLSSVSSTSFVGSLTGTASNATQLNGVPASSYMQSASLATVATSGSYNDLLNKPAAYSLPIASASVLGGIKIGSGLSIDGAGVVSAAGGGGSGTVTSVSGTGTVNGLTLTGSVTTTGSLTLGGTLSSIANSALTNSSITIGSTNVDLGSTATTLAGLTSVTATTFTGALAGNATSATTISSQNDIATATTVYPLWKNTSTGTGQAYVSSGNLGFVPSTGILSALGFNGPLTGNVTGNVSGSAATAATATNATNSVNSTNVTVINQTGVATSVYPMWADSASGYITPGVSSTRLSFVPSTGILSASGFAGPLTGTASNATQTLNVYSSNDLATAAVVYPLWKATSGGYDQTYVSTSKLSFVPSTGILSASGFAGPLVGNVTGNVSGSAATSTSLTTGRTFSLTGDATGTSAAFDGSANASIPLTLANSGVTIGTYTKVTVDVKGRVTVGASLASSDVTTALGFTPYNATNPAGYVTSSGSVASSTNLAGGAIGSIPYQSANGTTLMLASSTAGFVLTSNGAAAPSWQAASASAAPAGTLTGTTLAANVVTSSLTSVGTLTGLTINGIVAAPTVSGATVGIDVSIKGGASVSGTAGRVLIAGGISSGGQGGDLNFTAGTGSTQGGAVTIAGGQISTTGGSPGAVTISGGAQLNAGSFFVPGSATISGGFTNVTGMVAGHSYVLGGQAASSTGIGGNANISGGLGGASGSGGSIIISTAPTNTLVERFRILNNGAWSVGSAGTNTGTSGQVLASTGATTPPAWTTLTGASLAANTFTGAQIFSDQIISRAMLQDCGLTFLDKGNSSTTAQTLDYTAGSVQKITATGAFTLSTSNWPPSGNFGVIQLELANGGAFAITWPTINWIKPDGSTTTVFATWLAASTGRTALQTSGIDKIKLETTDAGTTIYGRFA